MKKNDIRNDMKRRLAKIEHDEYLELSGCIKEKFLKEGINKKSHTIGMTISNFPEVDTKELIQALWNLGKQVVVPRCNSKERTMQFYLLEDFNDLENVYMNLWEPKVENSIFVPKDEIDLLVVPGIVYSINGYRIGYGGGYFDRYLVNYKGDTVSLAFNCQITESVPTDVFDLPINRIITEDQLINCEEYRKAGAHNEDCL